MRCVNKKQINVSFSCVCPVIDNEFRNNIIKVVCGSTRLLLSYFNNVMTKFMIKSGTETRKTDVNLLICHQHYSVSGISLYVFSLASTHALPNWSPVFFAAILLRVGHAIFWEFCHEPTGTAAKEGYLNSSHSSRKFLR